MARFRDQILLMYALLTFGCSTLCAAPSCHDWGANSRARPQEERATARRLQQPSLLFLAVACLVQVLLGRQYVIENSAFSDIFTAEDSPLRPLRDMPHHVRKIDQCMAGAAIESQPIKKATHIQSNLTFGGICALRRLS